MKYYRMKGDGSEILSHLNSPEYSAVAVGKFFYKKRQELPAFKTKVIYYFITHHHSFFPPSRL